MPINTKSIRTKMLGLLAFIALVVGGVSVVYDLRAGGAIIRDEIVKRGRYVASNLAFNAKYGVLTEDKPLLTQFLEGASAPGGAGERSDVVGALIRDGKGAVLAQTGKALRDRVDDRIGHRPEGWVHLRLFRQQQHGSNHATSACRERVEPVPAGVVMRILRNEAAHPDARVNNDRQTLGVACPRGPAHNSRRPSRTASTALTPAGQRAPISAASLSMADCSLVK